MSALAGRLLMMGLTSFCPAAMAAEVAASSNFSSWGFSMYPSWKMKSRLSPGASVTARQCEATGLQPCATLSEAEPASTRCGASKPLYRPMKLSRSVSKPSTGALTV